MNANASGKSLRPCQRDVIATGAVFFQVADLKRKANPCA
jgi:hypothetical protein